MPLFHAAEVRCLSLLNSVHMDLGLQRLSTSNIRPSPAIDPLSGATHQLQQRVSHIRTVFEGCRRRSTVATDEAAMTNRALCQSWSPATHLLDIKQLAIRFLRCVFPPQLQHFNWSLRFLPLASGDGWLYYILCASLWSAGPAPAGTPVRPVTLSCTWLASTLSHRGANSSPCSAPIAGRLCRQHSELKCQAGLTWQ